MKNISLITAITVIAICMPLLSQQSETADIIEALTFPEAEIRFGNQINDPFFALSIQKKNVNNEEVKSSILKIQNELNDKSDPDLYLMLGKRFKELNDIDNAATAFRKYIELTSSDNIITLEDSKRILDKGDVYYLLYEIDFTNKRSDNLEKSLLYFTRAVELNPEDMTAWSKLGDCYLLSEKTMEAMYCYGRISEKNKSDMQIYTKLQAASFQRDYLKMIKSMAEDNSGALVVNQGFNFDYIETAINNSTAGDKEILKLHHYIYLLRLMILNDEYNRSLIKKNKAEGENINKNENKTIIPEIEKLVKSLKGKSIDNESAEYLLGIISYLKADYKKAISDFKGMIKAEKKIWSVYDDILFINMNVMKNDTDSKKTAEEVIRINPAVKYYLILAEIEFRNKNYSRSEMLCTQSLKISTNYAEAYSGLSVVYALNGNYIAADEMIKKGNSIIRKQMPGRQIQIDMKVNEAAIALLKNEKERAYILLRSVLSVDNNDKARKLYNRYFVKK